MIFIILVESRIEYTVQCDEEGNKTAYISLNGTLYSLDNRRLYVVQQIGVKINYNWATNDQIQNRV